MKKILIVGGSGQFSYYLTKFLLKKKYKIFISNRTINSKKILFFKKSFRKRDVHFLKINILNNKNIFNIIKKVDPNFIFYFAGQSSVVKSFKKRRETFLSNFSGCYNVLNVILKLKIKVKFFNASSSEIFANSHNPLKLNSKKNPKSPYGKAKLMSFNLIKKYRKKFNLELYNGIIFNTESFLRPNNYVMPKICISAIRCKKYSNKNNKFLKFGNIESVRDWGWCEEYVKSIWYNMQLPPHDFMVATGNSYSVKELLNIAFKYFNLDWKKYIDISKIFIRKKEITSIRADKSYLKKSLVYMPRADGPNIVKKLIKYYVASSRFANL